MPSQITITTKLTHDDRPTDGNNGVQVGLAHLERFGFKEGQKVEVTIKLIRYEDGSDA